MKKHLFLTLGLLALFIGGCYESPEEPNPIISGDIPSVTTDSLVENFGVMAIFAGNVKGDGGNSLYDNGFIVATDPNPTFQTPGVALGGTKKTKLGVYQTTVAGLDTSTNYYYRAFAMNAKGVAYGEVQSFRTMPSAQFKTPYETDFNPDRAEITRVGWALDTFSGYGDYDYVFWYNLEEEVGIAKAGWAIVAYYDTDSLQRPLKIVSPKFRIAKGDYLYFSYIPQLFRTKSRAVNAKVYITEDLSNLGVAILNSTAATASPNTFSKAMASYEGKDVFIVFEVLDGNFTLYHFGVSGKSQYGTTTDRMEKLGPFYFGKK